MTDQHQPAQRGQISREMRQALCLHDNAVGDMTMIAIREGQSACYESPEYRNWRIAQRQVISLVHALLDALDAAEARIAELEGRDEAAWAAMHCNCDSNILGRCSAIAQNCTFATCPLLADIRAGSPRQAEGQS